MDSQLHILGIAGSLRKHSVNKGLLRAAQTVLPEGVSLEVFDLGPIPLYNEDILTAGVPESIRELKSQVAEADALLIAIPEYNYSVPGVLKNAIDWVSRPIKESPLNGKPVALMGAGGVMGTVRAQLAFRQMSPFLNLHILNKPEVLVSRAWEKFDAEGNLKDEPTLNAIRGLLAALAEWTRLLRAPVAA